MTDKQGGQGRANEYVEVHVMVKAGTRDVLRRLVAEYNQKLGVNATTAAYAGVLLDEAIEKADLEDQAHRG